MDMCTQKIYLTKWLKVRAYISNLKGEREGREKASDKKNWFI